MSPDSGAADREGGHAYRLWLFTETFEVTRASMKYTICAALEEEYDAGWVWLENPPFTSRTPIELRIPRTRWRTFCEARHIDQNFRDTYDAKPHTIKLKPVDGPPVDNPLVISQWYRHALGGVSTSRHREGQQTEIQIRKLWFPGWRTLRVASHHPDMAVRIGLGMAMLGTWLAVVGLAAWVLDHREPLSEFIRVEFPDAVTFFSSFLPTAREIRSILFLSVVGGLTALLCWLPCRKPKRLQHLPANGGSGRIPADSALTDSRGST